MALGFLLDENLRGPLWHAITRHNLTGGLGIDAIRVGDLPELPLGSSDDVVLAWCEKTRRLLVSLDYDTMPGHVTQHLARGGHLPGVLLVRPGKSLRELVAELALIANAGRPEDYRDLVSFVP